MTTLTLNIKDDSKVEDVLRFLRDIDFLEVSEKMDRKSPYGLDRFQGVDLGWTKGTMTRDDMNAR